MTKFNINLILSENEKISLNSNSSFTWDEFLTEEENDYKILTFSVAAKETDLLEHFRIGRVLDLDLPEKEESYKFVISSISPVYNEKEDYYEIEAQDYASFVFSKNNVGLNLNTFEDEDYLEWLDEYGRDGTVKDIVEYIMMKGSLVRREILSLERNFEDWNGEFLEPYRDPNYTDWIESNKGKIFIGEDGASLWKVVRSISSYVEKEWVISGFGVTWSQVDGLPSCSIYDGLPVPDGSIYCYRHDPLPLNQDNYNVYEVREVEKFNYSYSWEEIKDNSWKLKIENKNEEELSNKKINLEISDSNTYNALIEVATITNSLIFFDYKNKIITFIEKDHPNLDKNFQLSPEFNLQELDISFSGEEFYPILFVEGGIDDRGMIVSLIPYFTYPTWKMIEKVFKDSVLTLGEEELKNIQDPLEKFFTEKISDYIGVDEAKLSYEFDILNYIPYLDSFLLSTEYLINEKLLKEEGELNLFLELFYKELGQKNLSFQIKNFENFSISSQLFNIENEIEFLTEKFILEQKESEGIDRASYDRLFFQEGGFFKKGFTVPGYTLEKDFYLDGVYAETLTNSWFAPIKTLNKTYFQGLSGDEWGTWNGGVLRDGFRKYEDADGRMYIGEKIFEIEENTISLEDVNAPGISLKTEGKEGIDFAAYHENKPVWKDWNKYDENGVRSKRFANKKVKIDIDNSNPILGGPFSKDRISIVSVEGQQWAPVVNKLQWDHWLGMPEVNYHSSGANSIRKEGDIYIFTDSKNKEYEARGDWGFYRKFGLENDTINPERLDGESFKWELKNGIVLSISDQIIEFLKLTGGSPENLEIERLWGRSRSAQGWDNFNVIFSNNNDMILISEEWEGGEDGARIYLFEWENNSYKSRGQATIDASFYEIAISEVHADILKTEGAKIERDVYDLSKLKIGDHFLGWAGGDGNFSNVLSTAQVENELEEKIKANNFFSGEEHLGFLTMTALKGKLVSKTSFLGAYRLKTEGFVFNQSLFGKNIFTSFSVYTIHDEQPRIYIYEAKVIEPEKELCVIARNKILYKISNNNSSLPSSINIDTSPEIFYDGDKYNSSKSNFPTFSFQDEDDNWNVIQISRVSVPGNELINFKHFKNGFHQKTITKTFTSNAYDYIKSIKNIWKIKGRWYQMERTSENLIKLYNIDIGDIITKSEISGLNSKFLSISFSRNMFSMVIQQSPPKWIWYYIFEENGIRRNTNFSGPTDIIFSSVMLIGGWTIYKTEEGIYAYENDHTKPSLSIGSEDYPKDYVRGKDLSDSKYGEGHYLVKGIRDDGTNKVILFSLDWGKLDTVDIDINNINLSVESITFSYESSQVDAIIYSSSFFDLLSLYKGTPNLFEYNHRLIRKIDDYIKLKKELLSPPELEIHGEEFIKKELDLYEAAIGDSIDFIEPDLLEGKGRFYLHNREDFSLIKTFLGTKGIEFSKCKFINKGILLEETDSKIDILQANSIQLYYILVENPNLSPYTEIILDHTDGGRTLTGPLILKEIKKIDLTKDFKDYLDRFEGNSNKERYKNFLKSGDIFKGDQELSKDLGYSTLQGKLTLLQSTFQKNMYKYLEMEGSKRVLYKNSTWGKLQEAKKEKEDVWFEIKEKFGNILLEGYYTNETENDAQSLFKQALISSKLYSQPSQEYSITYLDASDLVGQDLDLIKVGDRIHLNKKEDIGKLKFNKDLQVSSVSRELRRAADIQIEVQDIKRNSSIIEKILKSVRTK